MEEPDIDSSTAAQSIGGTIMENKSVIDICQHVVAPEFIKSRFRER